MTSPWRHPSLDFYEILVQLYKRHIKAAYQISYWSNIRELRYTVGKLTKNYEEKKDFEPLWPKVTNFNRVWASALSNRLAKTAFKSMYPFGWNFVHKKRAGHTHRQTDRQTDTQTNCSENITPPRFRGGIKKSKLLLSCTHKIIVFVKEIHEDINLRLSLWCRELNNFSSTMCWSVFKQ